LTDDSDAVDEAYQSQSELQRLVETALDENTMLKEKLQGCRDAFGALSIATRRADLDSATVRNLQDGDDTATIRVFDMNRSRHDVGGTSATSAGSRPMPFAFEGVLNRSWVYRRNVHSQDCDRSFTTATARSHAWSAFTGFSLGDISVLSVIAMPLCATDVTNQQHYISRGATTPMDNKPRNPRASGASQPSAQQPGARMQTPRFGSEYRVCRPISERSIGC